jgi:hypothetical protein
VPCHSLLYSSSDLWHNRRLEPACSNTDKILRLLRLANRSSSNAQIIKRTQNYQNSRQAIAILSRSTLSIQPISHTEPMPTQLNTPSSNESFIKSKPNAEASAQSGTQSEPYPITAGGPRPMDKMCSPCPVDMRPRGYAPECQ